MSEKIHLHLGDSLQVSISDEDLVSKTTDTENHFIERKTVSDSAEQGEQRSDTGG